MSAVLRAGRLAVEQQFLFALRRARTTPRRSTPKRGSRRPHVLEAIDAAGHAAGEHLQRLVRLDPVEAVVVEHVQRALVDEQAVRALEHVLVEVDGDLAVLHDVDLLALRIGDVQRALVVHEIVELDAFGDRDLVLDLALPDVDDTMPPMSAAYSHLPSSESASPFGQSRPVTHSAAMTLPSSPTLAMEPLPSASQGSPSMFET